MNNEAIILCDASNAYNNLDRGRALKTIKRNSPDMYTTMKNFFGAP